MKRFMSLFLTLIMLITITGTAFAVEESEGNKRLCSLEILGTGWSDTHVSLYKVADCKPISAHRADMWYTFDSLMFDFMLEQYGGESVAWKKQTHY